IAVVGRPAKHRDAAVVPDVAVLDVTRDVAEHDVTTLARPCRALGPQGAGPYTVDCALAAPQRQKGLIDDNHIRVRIDRRMPARKVARRIADYCRRRAEVGALLGPRPAPDRSRQSRRAGEHAAPRQRPAEGSFALHSVSLALLWRSIVDRRAQQTQPPADPAFAAMRNGNTITSISQCGSRERRVLELFRTDR